MVFICLVQLSLWTSGSDGLACCFLLSVCEINTHNLIASNARENRTLDHGLNQWVRLAAVALIHN